jgi:hypothetical protein
VIRDSVERSKGSSSVLFHSLDRVLPSSSSVRRTPWHPFSQERALSLAQPVFSVLVPLVCNFLPSRDKDDAADATSFPFSAQTGVAELLVFHPVDTIAKRLMSNKSKVSASNLSSVIFRDKASAPFFTRIFSLFPGLGYAAGYKITQRIYKFGGQPWFNDIIRGTPAVCDAFTNTFGERRGKTMMHATAGSLTGIGEVVLLPLDALKIKMQVNPDAFRGRGVFRIFREEGSTLYRGWGWTMARNAPGSFAVRILPFSTLCSLHQHHIFLMYSSSVPRQQQKSTSSASRTTPRRPGPKTLSRPSQGPSRQLLSLHPWTRSRRASRTRTLRPSSPVSP